MKSLLVLLMLGMLVSCGTEDTSSEGTDDQGNTPDPMVVEEPEPADDPDPARTPPEQPEPVDGPDPAPEVPVADLPEDNNSLAIAQISLVSSAGAGSPFMDVAAIENGFELNLASISADTFNIVAKPADEAFSGSILFELTGPTSLERFENAAPFTLAPEPANFSTEDGLTQGFYRLLVTPYELPDLQGAIGQTFVLAFDVLSDSDEAERTDTVPSILAIEVGAFDETSNSLTETLPVTDGTLIDLADYLEQQINFVAVSEDASQTGSVQFSLAGPEGFTEINRTDNSAPFFLESGSVNFLGNGTPLPNGEYTLMATPYELASAAGDAGATRELTFVIMGIEDSADAPSDDPADSPIEDPVEDTPPPRDNTPPSPPAIDIVGSDDGFTPIVPSSDTRQIFVSSSIGDDANTCLTENDPCATIEQGIERMRSGFPDHLLLRRGDTWRVGGEALNDIQNGRSPSEPAVVSYYGDSGDRPIIEAAGTLYRQDNRDVRHIAFQGLHFFGYLKDPESSEFDPTGGDANLRFIGRFDDILIEDCKFEFAGMTIQSIGEFRPKNFVVRRNIFAGVYDNESSFTRSARPSNVFTVGVDGQHFEENVFDFGGWHPTVPGAGANQLAHNVYLQWTSDSNTTFFINNISVRGASHGVQMRSCGLAQDNFFARNSLGILMGYGFEGRECPAGVRAHAIDNVASEGISMQGKGVNPCVAGNVCTSALRGIDIPVNSEADYQAHGNIASNVVEEDVFRVLRSLNFNLSNGRTSFPNSNNIAFNWNSPDEGANQGYSDPTRTLSDYNEFLGGENDFDQFMNTVKNRPVGTWDVRYTARAINAYIRAGFLEQ